MAMSSPISGLYGIADAQTSPDPVRLAAAMLEGGCRLIQLRAKHWSPADILHAANQIMRLIRQYEAVFIINDHPHLAAASNAHGVHVGQTDGDATDVRRIIGPNRILGRSTNSINEIERASKEADYLAFGPIFPTTHLSRPKSVRGLDLLRQARSRCPLPLVAIGGIDSQRLGTIRHLADSWAVIGAIAAAADPVEATRMLL